MLALVTSHHCERSPFTHFIIYVCYLFFNIKIPFVCGSAAHLSLLFHLSISDLGFILLIDSNNTEIILIHLSKPRFII